MKGLLSVSFGTSYEDARIKAIDPIDAELAAAFPDRAFYSAWTSPRIIAKVLKERGERHLSLEEAFESISADGIDDLVIATMCLMNGGEMKKIRNAAKSWVEGGARSARLASPVLSTEADHEMLAKAIASELEGIIGDDVALFMGHGSTLGSNQLYADAQSTFRSIGKERYLVATVEGSPTLEDAIPVIQSMQAKRVVLAPLMIVAGDHARNDLAGDDEGSWANQLESLGFQTDALLKGLGEYSAVRQLIVDHARSAEAI